MADTPSWSDPAPTLAASTTLNHDAEAAWALLNDVRAAARCVPKAEIGHPLGDGTYPARIRLAMGPLGRNFEGMMRVLGTDERTRTLRLGFADNGQEVATTPPVRVTFRLEPTSTGAVLYADMWLPGRVGRLGGGFGGDIARGLFVRFGQRLDAALADPGRP
ncbi:MAG: hypothetical protein ACRDN9_17625 [Streptosporangiaceae bacterium]